MIVAPVWILLVGLPEEYWDMEIMWDIWNSIGEYVKVTKQTHLQRYTTFAQICVYMDLSKELPEAISMNWDNKE